MNFQAPGRSTISPDTLLYTIVAAPISIRFSKRLCEIQTVSGHPSLAYSFHQIHSSSHIFTFNTATDYHNEYVHLPQTHATPTQANIPGDGPSAEHGEPEVRYRFPDRLDFVERHRVGTYAEHELELWEVRKFNAKKIPFQAWSVIQFPGARADGLAKKNNSVWLFLVEIKRLQERLLEEGDLCQIKILRNNVRGAWWAAERIPMPTSFLGTDQEWDKFGAFKVTVPATEDESDSPVTLLSPSMQVDKNFERMGNPILTSSNSFRVIFQMTVSNATFDIENEAIKYVLETDPEHKKGQVLSYWLSLSKPQFNIKIRNHLPQLSNPINIPMPLRDGLKKLFDSFDAHQVKAFEQLLSKAPCGVCILPGGPGAGKTRWNLVVAAIAQARDAIIIPPSKTVVRPVKILYLLDINKPLNDIASRMVSLYRELGMQKIAIRMYSWKYERIKLDDRKQKEERQKIDFKIENNRASGPGEVYMSGMGPITVGTDNQMHDFSPKFIEAAFAEFFPPRARIKTRDDCLAPTLDEAAWQYYKKNKDQEKYKYLREMMDDTLRVGWASELFKVQLNGLYQELFKAADFIATTPVAASKNLSTWFDPDLVFFDEAPHAREASTLSAIANFNPIAWIFTGDPRQTRPFVRHVPGHPELDAQPTPTRSYNNVPAKPPPNPWRAQMQVSMMERADKLGVIKHSLLINHRARAGLHKLPSSLFYDGKMETALTKDSLYPEPTRHLMRWISTLLKKTCQIPRVRVNLDCSSADVGVVGTSSYNTKHLNWVMDQVRELVLDPKFMHPDGKERGTILVMAPYKEAFFRYRTAIRELSRLLNRKLGPKGVHATCKVEARTVDTAQGHEADVVFLDLVRVHVTAFLGDRNRLNVAMTRARQAEFLIADDDMIDSEGWNESIMKEIFAGQTHVYNQVDSLFSDMNLNN